MVVRMQRCGFNLSLLHLLKDFRENVSGLFVLCGGVIPPRSSRGQRNSQTSFFFTFLQSFQIFVSTPFDVWLWWLPKTPDGQNGGPERPSELQPCLCGGSYFSWLMSDGG